MGHSFCFLLRQLDDVAPDCQSIVEGGHSTYVILLDNSRSTVVAAEYSGTETCPEIASVPPAGILHPILPCDLAAILAHRRSSGLVYRETTISTSPVTPLAADQGSQLPPTMFWRTGRIHELE
jgi:hypothetical protein